MNLQASLKTNFDIIIYDYSHHHSYNSHHSHLSHPSNNSHHSPHGIYAIKKLYVYILA